MGILLLGRALSQFNGGRTQAQSNAPYQGDFPFINLVKVSDPWRYSTSTTESIVPPSSLDATGYPKAGVPVLGNVAIITVDLPPNYGVLSNSSDPMVVTWEGNAKLDIGNAAFTYAGVGSVTPVLNGYGFSDGLYHGRYEWYPTAYNADGSYSINIGFETITNYADKLACFIKSSETNHLAGKYFQPKYLDVLRTAKFGVFRFMDWLATNGGMVTTWDTRKKVSKHSWQATDFRAAWWGGQATKGVGNNYALTVDSGYSWSGPNGNHTPGGAPVHNQTMHISVDADATLVYQDMTVTGISPIELTGVGHPFSNGDQVGLTVNQFPGIQPGINYFVVNKTATTIQVALTSGGSAMTAPSGNGTVLRATLLPTLNINGTGAYPLKQATFTSYPITFNPPVQSAAFGKKLYSTVIFDANFNSWIMTGGNNDTSSGVINNVPPEVCLALCIELGMHPHWTTPLLSMDPMTDWTTQLATYQAANNPGWMVPHYEACNEFFNSSAGAGAYGNSIAGKLWYNTSNGFNWPNWQGKCASTVGQAIAAVHGLGNLGTTYEYLIGVQTDGFGFEVTSAPYLTSDDYIAQAAAAQTGYTKSAAKGWASALTPATYYAPSFYRSYREPQIAWDWVYNHAGNSAAQTADLNTYVDSLSHGLIGGPSLFTSGTPGIINWPSHGQVKGTLLNINTVGSGNVFPTGLGSPRWVGTVLNANQFCVSNSQGGSDIAFSGSATGTFYLSVNSFNLVYFQARYGNVKALGTANSISKMMAYEGGFSADTALGGDWFSPITAATKAASCVLTLPQTWPPSGPIEIVPGLSVGMVIAPRDVVGMTQLNCAAFTATFTAGSASIAGTNTLIAGQMVMFPRGASLPPNVSANTPYYVIATGLSGSTFQISLTKGGTAITAGGSGSYVATADNGWRVTGVSGNDVTIDVNSTGFGTYTSGGYAMYTQMTDIVNQLRSSCFTAPDLYDRTLENYANFATMGGTFGSQYMIAGPPTASWRVIYPNIYGMVSTAYNAIVAYNA